VHYVTQVQGRAVRPHLLVEMPTALFPRLADYAPPGASPPPPPALSDADAYAIMVEREAAQRAAAARGEGPFRYDESQVVYCPGSDDEEDDDSEEEARPSTAAAAAAGEAGKM
jgi:hypothetical protein